MIGTKKQCINFLMDASGDEFEVKASKRKRSNDANGFYWTLLTQYAKYRKTSNDSLHEEMLGKYSIADLDEDGRAVTVTMKADIPVTRLPGHWKEYKVSQEWASYFRIKGSSEMNTKEFSDLLDGLISEIEYSKAQEPTKCDIDTLTPTERNLLKGYMPKWERNAPKNESNVNTATD